MVSFFISLLVLLIGYLVYGAIVERVFGPDERKTPAIILRDDIDYIPLKNWKVFLIQLLNIAGLGPIFGALAGAVWGPVVFLWIVFGSIFAGAVHDYLTGMISLRHKGCSVPEVVGLYLGDKMKIVMRIFSVVLLVLVGTVFATGPANLLAMLTPETLDAKFWLLIIFIYYFGATMLPIDKLIGKLYPIFGFCLFFMAVSIVASIIGEGYHIPEITLANLHPDASPVWPLMFITVACGAISGFHSTQSPLMARCLKNERSGRRVFYGAMIAEGVIALIWAAAGVAFYETTGGLQAALGSMTQSGVVYQICNTLLGPFGAVLAIIGVIACPITSGDTAFRSARLTIADWFSIEQKKHLPRLAIAIPILGLGAVLSQNDFNAVWRYFSWSNQTLAMIVLWAGAVYLFRHRKNYWIALIPAFFMSAVSCTYILIAKEGFTITAAVSYPAGIIFAIICSLLFLKNTLWKNELDT